MITQHQFPNSAQPDCHTLIKILRTAGYSPLLFKKFGIWVVLYTSTMNIYFSELSVYVEAIINAISPSSSTFSTTILTVSSILDAFYSTKVCRQINKDHA